MSFKKNWKSASKWFLTRPNTTGMLVFFLFLLLVSFLVKLRYNSIRENQHREISSILNVIQHNFEQVFKNSYTATLALAMSINDDGNPENFDEIAAQLVENNESIDAVQLVPNGIIKYVYPYEENKAALNYNILSSPKVKQEALKSIETKQIYFAGPIVLKQGGMGVIGRLPVFKKGKFWGFSAVLIRLETLKKISGIESIDNMKYYFQFSKINPITKKEAFFFKAKEDLSKKCFQTVIIPEGDWKLYLIARDRNALYSQLITSSTLGILFSLVCGLWVASIMKKPARLELLVRDQEEKIVDSEREFKAIFDQSQIGIARIETPTGKFVSVNPEFCKIIGYSEQEITKMNFQSITHPDDVGTNLNAMEKLQNGRINALDFEKRYIHKSGKTIWVNLTVSGIGKIGDKPTNHIAIVEDITEKKKAEEELKQSFELVSDQNKRLLNFSYIVSHNLRSHTSNIETISNFLETAETKEERDEMIDLLKKVSHSLNETMTNLNEVVSIRTNINLSIEPLNVNHYIEKAQLILSQQITAKQVVIENLVSPSITVNYNTAYLESILFNLISNAIRYSHADRVPKIKITFDSETNTLKVQDNGIGIDLKRNSEKMFGMYKTFNNNPDSKGIGLFIVKNQIDAMGGSITVESSLNEGTTFTIFFK
jgi:PAS domain S-box-containing protein